MPKNYKLSMCLSRLPGAFISNLRGRSTTKRCLCIPVEDADLFETEHGDVYLNLKAYEMKEERYGKTHLVKQSLSKERYDAMTDEERRELPIIGNLSPIDETQRRQPTEGPTMDLPEDDDLPF